MTANAYDENKVSLSAYDDNRWITDDGVCIYAKGSSTISQESLERFLQFLRSHDVMIKLTRDLAIFVFFVIELARDLAIWSLEGASRCLGALEGARRFFEASEGALRFLGAFEDVLRVSGAFEDVLRGSSYFYFML